MTAPASGIRPEVLTLGETMVLFEAVHEPVLRLGSRFTLHLAGAESNFAIALARLGLNVTWASRVGDDRYGQLLTETLASEGVDLRYVKISGSRPTGVFFKWHEDSIPRIVYYRRGSAATELEPSDVPEQALDGVRLVHLTGITSALSSTARDLVLKTARHAHEMGATVTFDPNYRPALWPDPRAAMDGHRSLLPHVDWYLCGESEGRLLFGVDSNEELWRTLRQRGARGACIRTGRDGALVSDGSRLEPVRPSRTSEVLDEVGAGDGFAAGFAYGLRHGWDPVECAHAGNTVARAALGVPGDWESYPRLNDFLAEL